MEKITSEILAQVAAHGEKEGREDYAGRSEDVARGAEEPAWAWPFNGADDAYINAVGISQICDEIGVDEATWEDVSDTWLAAFKRGFEAEHADRTGVGFPDRQTAEEASARIRATPLA